MSMGDDYQETPENEKSGKQPKNAIMNRLEILLLGEKKLVGLALDSLRPSETTLSILSFVYGSLGSNSYLLTSLACR